MSQSHPQYQPYQPYGAQQPVMVVQVAQVEGDSSYVNPLYGEVAVKSRCPFCKHVGFTRIDRSVGVSTWAVCLALTFFCAFPCNYYPFCIPQCKDIVHKCSSCGQVIGKKALFG